jgi:hypothetical protein
MLSTLAKITVASAAVGGLSVGTAAAVVAAGDDSIKPANTVVTASLKPGTTFVGTGKINGITIKVTCTKVTITGKTPKKGLTYPLSKPPSFTGCTVSGLAATITTTGKWITTFIPSPNRLQLTIPKDGATFTTKLVQGCKVIIAANGPAKIADPYNENTGTASGTVKVPTKGVGCTTSPTGTITASLVLNPKIKVVS